MGKIKKKNEYLFHIFSLGYFSTFQFFGASFFHYFLCKGKFLVLGSW